MSGEPIPVDPTWFAYGTYDHELEKEIGEGPISKSYSADLIATNGKVRKPFRYQGHFWTATSLAGKGGIQSAEAYRLIPEKLFDGSIISYQQKTGGADSAEAARQDPLGFYHGMLVRFKGAGHALVGPPAHFIAASAPERPAVETEPAQMSLFGP